jgi:endoglucanase
MVAKILRSTAGRRGPILALAILAGATIAGAAPPGTVRLNQVGFETLGPKRAMHASVSKAPLRSTLVDGREVVREEGQTIPFGEDRYSG